MRVLACGDRNWTEVSVIARVLLEVLKPGDVLIDGLARGADLLAHRIASSMEGVSVEGYPADWARYRKAAGPIRNQQMLDSGVDLVLAFHNDLAASRGTADMVRRARKAKVPVRIFTEDKEVTEPSQQTLPLPSV